jgi:hypothetical protein
MARRPPRPASRRRLVDVSDKTRSGLTSVDAREELFSREFVFGANRGNGAASAKAAGYAAKSAAQNARRLLARPRVIARIAQLKAERDRQIECRGTDTIRKLDYVIDEAITERNWPAALKGLEMKGRHEGLRGFGNRVDLVLSEEATRDALRRALTVVANHTTAEQFEAIAAHLDDFKDDA